jgi:phage terminase large subunit-like protein
VGSVPQNAASRMEKIEDLQKMIKSTCFTYAQQLKMAWDVKN